MKLPFYNGIYKMLPAEVDSMRKRATPTLGEVMRHRSMVLILHCPACRSLQFAAADLSGTEDAPTTSPIHCGAGTCKKCGIWFRIIDGHAAVVPEPDRPKTPISETLAAAGVKPPPKLPER
jgi:uncharacterized protein YbaR (Trm112 family)